MQRLGFDSRLSRTIGNYLSRGGKFYRKEDVLKIYGMTDSIYRRIEPYIVMVKQETQLQSDPSQVSPVIANSIIELNTADTSLLKTLPGIGSVLSGRIIRFRDLLGGFCDPEQLLEVYGISEELYGQINRFVRVDENMIRKIDICNASFNELLRHPYISYEQAGAISRFVKGNVQFQNPVILLEAGIIDTISFYKLSPYLLSINE
jgi:DNA uptake protein ComE-like DNA-binding protein